MPVDMAMRICLASSPPLRSFLGNYDNCCPSSTAALLPRCEPLRPCLSSKHCSETSCLTEGTSTTMALSSNGWARKTKKVVFADSKGMALTDIHVFKETEEDPLAELQFHLTDLEGATARIRLEEEEGPEDHSPCLVLDFPQPASDYLELRNRLKAQQVCLENCSVQERSLSGTVKVQNISFEKSVAVRITFNSWLSFEDVPCIYLNNVYSCPETDTFAFSISFPEVLEPSERVEFCIQYQAKNQIFWDNNNGKNYCLVPANSNQTGTATGTVTLEIQRDSGRERKVDMEFDRFGSPRTSAGIFPEWQSWGRLESSTPYW
ncbi:protein phosphatase 1 regulatory subunit 3C-B isoform X2 [Lampris incognitus]|nr:protein phosphatase 1 regulatory subunit 3C-B isoform X2 [Lampris incognitus]